MNNKKRSTKERVLLAISLVGGLGILPFAIYRLSMQEWAIGTMDLIASVGVLLLFHYVYKTHQVQLASKILSIISLTSIVTTVYLKGYHQMYWAYPAILSVFYLLKPKTGLIFALITIGTTFPILYQETNLMTLGTLLITLIITSIFAYVFSNQMRDQRRLLTEQATKDPLTGAGNRRALAKKMSQIISTFQRTKNDTSLLLIDMDHFKKVNDTFGHNAGDRFLTQITKVLKSRIRITDSLYRFGGEEFIIVAEHTYLTSAEILAEELRSTIEKGQLIAETEVTVSIGVAQLKLEEVDEQWIKRADRALFKAKETGRNKVCVSTN